MSDQANVPCNGCTLCCRNDVIMLHPELGDRPKDFLTVPYANQLTGEPGLMLAKKANGDCIYLGESGCTIHGRAPLICRKFDCGKAFKALPLKQRDLYVKAGLIGKDVLDRGREITKLRARGLA